MPINVDTKSLAGKYLPSVYVSEISIKDGGLSRKSRKQSKKDGKKDNKRQKLGKKQNKSLEVTISMSIKDVIEKDAISTWMENSDFTKYLRIKIIQSTNAKLTKLLSRGKFSALKLQKFKKDSKVSIIPVQKKNFDLKDYTKIHSSDGERIYEIPYQKKMIVEDRNPEHLSYFAYVYLDIADLAQHYGLKISKNKRFSGRIAKEDVIIRRKVNTTAYVFYLKETNQIWTGQKHKRNGQWFAGAPRRKLGARPLRRQRVPNGKIKDYRDITNVGDKKQDIAPALKKFQKIQKKQLNRDMTIPKVVESYISQGSVSPKQSGEVSILFHLDIRKWVREQSAFGSIIENSKNRRAIEEIYFHSKIKQLKLVRRRISKVPSINRLGTKTVSGNFDPSRQIIKTIIFSSDDKGFLKKSKSKIGAIREIQNLAFTSGVRTFTAEDKSMKDVTDGLYQYGVEIEAIDGTVVFLNKKLNRLIAAKNQLDLYYNDILCPKYVSPSGKFKQTLSRKYKNLKLRPWSAAIAVYLDVYSSINRLPMGSKVMAKKLFAMTNSATGTESGVYALLSMMQQLIDQIISALGSKRAQTFSLNTNLAINASSPGKASAGAKTPRQYKVSTLEISSYFNDTHDSNIPKNFGIDFLGKPPIQDIGVKSILISDFDNRVTQENNIYWKTDLASSRQTLQSEIDQEGVSASELAPILDLQSTEYSYLSPATISAGPVSVERTDMGQGIWAPEQYNTLTSTVVATASGKPPLGNAPNPSTSMAKKNSKSGAKALNQAGDNSNDILLSTLGVTIVETTEMTLEEFSSLSTASKKKLLVAASKILDDEDPLMQVSEEPCNNQLDSDNEQIEQRKRKRVKKKNSENKSAVSNVFMNNVAASGIYTVPGLAQTSPYTPSVVLPISDYDLMSSKNIVDAVRQSPLKKKQADKLPNQLKSLMFSRSNATKNNWLDQDQDPFKSPETSQMMKYNYSTFGRIEAFVGFEKDKDGNNIILKPKYRLLNKKIISRSKGDMILCRIENYENKDFGIGDNSLNMRIFDNCFIMSPSQAIQMMNKVRSISKKGPTADSPAADFAALSGIPSAQVSVGSELWRMTEQEKQEERLISVISQGSAEQIEETVVELIEVKEANEKLIELYGAEETKVLVEEVYDKDYEKASDQKGINKKNKQEESIEDSIGPTVEEEMLNALAETEESIALGNLEYAESSNNHVEERGIMSTTEEEDEEDNNAMGHLTGNSWGGGGQGQNQDDEEDEVPLFEDPNKPAQSQLSALANNNQLSGMTQSSGPNNNNLNAIQGDF